MRKNSKSIRHLLVGGGLSHLTFLKELKRSPIPYLDIIMISPDSSTYLSEGFSGYIEDFYPKESISVNLDQLTNEAGGQFIKDAVVSIDAVQKKLLTAQGRIMDYDTVSFDIGSLTGDTKVPGIREYAYRFKPNYRFIESIEATCHSGKVIIYGEGITSIETALAYQAWREEHGVSEPIVLLSPARLLPTCPQKISENIQQIIEKKGIELHLEVNVKRVEKGKLWTNRQVAYQYDHLIWLAKPKAPDLFKTSHLPVDPSGYLKIEDTLQVKAYPSIFGAGDCTRLSPHDELTMIRSETRRQGKLLYINLKGFLEEGVGRRYTPRANHLSILSMGHKEGILVYKGRFICSPWAWWLKDKLTQGFLSKVK